MMGSLFGRRVQPFNFARRFIAFEEETDKKKQVAQNGMNLISEFPSNFISTSRYSIVSFLPMSLLLQFKRYANIYFLVTAVLQCIPAISPLSAYVAVAPLIVVLTVSMTREGFEDYSRHKSDREQNFQAKAKRILPDRTEQEISWADIKVGNILKVSQDECFPADLLVLGSNLDGVCYIETGALDGEKNLKPKSALHETCEYFATNEKKENTKLKKEFLNNQSQFYLQVQAKIPDQDPNSFSGSIGFKIKGEGKEDQIKDIPVDQNQLVPRGAFLRNTENIYAVVVYTGMDTKIMKNAEEGKPKSSDMESKMNKFILSILAFQLTCAFIMSCCSFYWLNKNRTRNLFPYLNLDKNGLTSSAQSTLVYFSYFILFNTMIPISLIVSLEMVKVLQSYFITKDVEMYSAHNEKWPKVLTSTINEELGQVEYVFSDKTGTLTQNQMQFKMAIIGTTLYGEKAANQKKKPDHQPQPQKKSQHSLSEFVFEDQTLTQLLASQCSKEDNPQHGITLKSLDKKVSFQYATQLDIAKEFFMLLGLTHECIVEKNKDPSDTNLYYQGPSPDEITLVDAAYHMGFAFIGKTSNKLQMRITTGKEEKQKEVGKINIFEFTSTRKRNTLILEDNGVYKMYIKGADSIVKERLDKTIPQPFLDNADKKLTEFSVIGLRTLLMGVKIMSKQEVDDFLQKYNSLSNSPNRKEDLEKLAEEIEQGFFLIGATAVEDKLQDDVPETIHDLIRANIKVWMLTGDKLETAENIAKSCKLILEDFEELVMSDKNPKVIRKMMMEVLWHQFKKLKENNVRKCFLVEGDCLKVIFAEGNEDIKKKFVQITKDCESVVCCRVSPVQKAQVVRAIREGLDKITLAIGDGANDVNMIQAAHIGCGIYGNEGMRAVQSSDFAFGQFKCLWRLLFVHGRWSYIRISEMIIYFFYKNMQFFSSFSPLSQIIYLRIFTVPQLYFAFFSGFSAQSIFDDYYISMYNLIFTALPLVVRAVFDQDLNYLYLSLKEKLISNDDGLEKKRLEKLINKRKNYMKDKLPSLYYIGQRQQLFSTSIFIEWVLQGIVHGLLIFFISYFTVGSQIYENDGFTSDQWSFSLIIFTSVVLIADFKLALHTKYWTSITYFAFFVTSIGLYILAFFVTGALTSSNVYSTPTYLVQTPHFYLVIFLIVVGIFAVDIGIYSAKDLFSNKTKEQALRQLMNSQPNKNQEKNKWMFNDNGIELESNINSFIEKQCDESQIILSPINKSKQQPENNIQLNQLLIKNSTSLAEKPYQDQINMKWIDQNVNNDFQNTNSNQQNQRQSSSSSKGKSSVTPTSLITAQDKKTHQNQISGPLELQAISLSNQDKKGMEGQIIATLSEQEGKDEEARNPQDDGGELVIQKRSPTSPSPRGSVLLGVDQEGQKEPIYLITFSDSEDEGDNVYSSALHTLALKYVSPRTIQIVEDKKSNQNGAIYPEGQKKEMNKEESERK